MDEGDILKPRDVADLRDWLARHHDTAAAVHLAIRKKGSSAPGVTYEEAVEEALAWGWIDSTGHKLDADHFTVRLGRRKRGSVWARTNKERVARLTEAGRMRAPGLAAVEAAKADGSWNALDDVDALVVPRDLADALAADPTAARNFAAFPDSTRRMVLYRILGAKRPETRAKRVAESVAEAAANVKRVSP